MRFILAAVLASTALPAFSDGHALPVDGAPSAATVVATVDGTDITLGQMIVAAQRLPQQFRGLPPEVLFGGLLDQMVQQQLLADQLEEVPARVATTLEVERRSLLAGERLTELTAAATTEDAIRAAYDARVAGMEPAPEFDASHILVETEAEAQDIVAELEGGADFATLAAERSTGPSGPRGGALGWFGPGMMVPEFEQAVMELAPGEISAPVQTQFGWHVVRLNDTREAPLPTFAQMRDEILGEIQNATVQAALDGIEEGAQIARIEDGAIDPQVLGDLSLLEPADTDAEAGMDPAADMDAEGDADADADAEPASE
ncbi:MAG: peptidylprolyl isomerase [Paracoccaceae bacterium]